MRTTRLYLGALVATIALLAVACGDDATTTAEAPSSTTTTTTTTTTVAVVEDDSASTTTSTEAPAAETSTFVAEVWADNWFALHVNGELVGEDSVPITTERSFNAETITFEAAYPLTIAIEAKDFKETDSGIEYIGAGNQQMGDGGLIVQITDSATGDTVAVSDDSWSALVVHRAPLNTECERDPDPDTTCEFEITPTPQGWATADFDDAGWGAATVWSAADVSPKDGYDEIDWAAEAQLIWGSDLEVDNTVLLRTTVG
ncbi:MAG: PEBP family protein [Actinomycetota bacterium]